MNEEPYMKLPYDLSGAMSKNRFKNEILWGMHKILEIYTNEEDFNMVFDYVCDIEVHWKNGKYEFYQVKTSNSGEAYTQNKLTTIGKKEMSVLAKLYILKKNFSGNRENIQIALVSNKPFKDSNNKLYNSTEKLEYNFLDDNVKLQIEESLKKELNIDTVDLNNFNFIYTSIDLMNPKNTLTGELVNFFNDVLKVQIKKPAVLYSVLADKISQKAEYEMKVNTYDDLIKNKAITKKDIDELFNKHREISNNAVEKAKNNIEKMCTDSYMRKTKMIVALSSVVSNLSISKDLQKLEQEIIGFINNNITVLDTNFENVIKVLYEKYKDKFNIEYSEEEIKAFIILILMKREEEMYE